MIKQLDNNYCPVEIALLPPPRAEVQKMTEIGMIVMEAVMAVA
jgi:hypothetical protein